MYFSPTRPMFELYDLENDPNERKNLIDLPESREIERELRSVLAEWMILQHDFLPHTLATGRKAVADSATEE